MSPPGRLTTGPPRPPEPGTASRRLPGPPLVGAERLRAGARSPASATDASVTPRRRRRRAGFFSRAWAESLQSGGAERVSRDLATHFFMIANTHGILYTFPGRSTYPHGCVDLRREEAMGTANHRHPVRPYGSDASLRRGRCASLGLCDPSGGALIPAELSVQHERRRTLPGLRAASSTNRSARGKEVIL